MKAPIFSDNELTTINRVRDTLERPLYPDIPAFFDNGRTCPHLQNPDEYAKIGWVREALKNGEVLTAVNSDGAFTVKFFGSALGGLCRKAIERCELVIPSKK
jgi:hypothetical protein